MINVLSDHNSDTVGVHLSMDDAGDEAQINQFLIEAENVILALLGTAYSRLGTSGVNFLLDEVNDALPEFLAEIEEENIEIHQIAEQDILPL